MRHIPALSLALCMLAAPLAASAQAGPATPPPSQGIIVQGGLSDDRVEDGDCIDSPVVQPDDPRAAGTTGMVALGPKPDDPRAAGADSLVSLGPKQDDPRAAETSDMLAIGPKQDDPRAAGTSGMLAIGPKQDDPRASGNDATVAIRPKQDDPRAMGASDGPGMAGPRPGPVAGASIKCMPRKK